MSDTFIAKDGGSLYYLRIGEGAGGFLNPPSHPAHTMSIIEKRGGHETSSYSLEGLSENSWIPTKVQSKAKGILRRWESNRGAPDEAWLQSVYNYFRNCYSLDGENRSVSDCVIARPNEAIPNERHLGYLFVKQYYPDYTLRVDLLRESGPLGMWHKS